MFCSLHRLGEKKRTEGLRYECCLLPETANMLEDRRRSGAAKNDSRVGRGMIFVNIFGTSGAGGYNREDNTLGYGPSNE